MERNLSINASLLRLGGIAGIVPGLCVLSFALTSEINGLLFTPEVFEGASVNPWIQTLLEKPQLARSLPILPIIGFASMLIFGIVLYQLIGEKSWQKNLALVGYLIGVPVVVTAFVSQFSFINELITLATNNIEIGTQIQLLASFKMHDYMLINFAIGPFFIIIIGNSVIAWAALKAKVLPKWLCYWALFNGSLILLGMLSVMFPMLRFAQIGGPLTMLWFLTTGILLLKKSKTLG